MASIEAFEQFANFFVRRLREVLVPLADPNKISRGHDRDEFVDVSPKLVRHRQGRGGNRDNDVGSLQFRQSPRQPLASFPTIAK